MYVETEANTRISAELEHEIMNFSVNVDHTDGDMLFQIVLNETSRWINEADFNEIFKVMRKARKVKKTGIKV